MTSGAGYAPPESFAKAGKIFKNLMVKPTNGYGLTETVRLCLAFPVFREPITALEVSQTHLADLRTL